VVAYEAACEALAWCADDKTMEEVAKKAKEYAAKKEPRKQVIAAVRGGENLTQAENRIIGIDHARAGAYLLGVWGLSYDVIEAVAHHHAPQMVKQDGLDVLAAVSIAIALVAEVEAKGASRPDRAAAHVGAEYAAAAGLDTPWGTLLEQAAAVLADGAPA
jgi:HD-like signal output (HDOD) protein